MTTHPGPEPFRVQLTAGVDQFRSGMGLAGAEAQLRPLRRRLDVVLDEVAARSPLHRFAVSAVRRRARRR